MHQLATEPLDTALVLAARDGDARAREALFRRYAPLVNGMAYRLLGGDTDLDDLVQESFAQALACLNRLQNVETFPTWLATIVVRTAHKMIRRRRLMARFGLWRPPEIDWEQVRSQGASTEQLVELRAIYRLVHDMPADLRIPLVLRHVEDKTLQEIADLMDTSIATVKRRITKAQLLLEAAVREEQVDEGLQRRPLANAVEHGPATSRVATPGRQRHG